MALLLNAGDTVSRSYSYTQPSPLHPSQPQGTGNKTANLSDLYNVDKTQIGLRVTTGNNMRIVVNGTKGSGNNIFTIKTPNIVLPAGTYTLTIKMVGGEIKNTDEGAFLGINQSTYARRTTPSVKNIGDVGKRTFTISADTVISSFDITPSYGNVGSIWENAEFECMLYSGSDSIDYEPYGYKIPISSANTTTPVYLGEVQSTRKVKKVVLDGTEAFYASGSWGKTNTAVYYTVPPNAMNLSTNVAYTKCSHYVGASRNYIYDNDIECSGMTGSNSLTFRVNRQYAGTKEDFLAYLAAQYAAGTPVTIWYVLAEPETAVVNEPLMKIGDYADIVSDISVPVTAGGDTISVDATVQPSGVAINYKGWHNAKCKEYSYNMTIADWESASISQMENHTIQELQGGNWV